MHDGLDELPHDGSGLRLAQSAALVEHPLQRRSVADLHDQVHDACSHRRAELVQGRGCEQSGGCCAEARAEQRGLCRAGVLRRVQTRACASIRCLVSWKGSECTTGLHKGLKHACDALDL